MKPPPLPAQLEDGQLREPCERLCDIDRCFVVETENTRSYQGQRRTGLRAKFPTNHDDRSVKCFRYTEVERFGRILMED